MRGTHMSKAIGTIGGGAPTFFGARTSWTEAIPNNSLSCRALLPSHARMNGRLYRYYMAQKMLKGDGACNSTNVRQVSVVEFEVVAVGQVRALLRRPEIVVSTWRAARREALAVTENETHDALQRLDPLWERLFLVEHARIFRSLVERVMVGPADAHIRLRIEGLAGHIRDFTPLSRMP